MGDTEWLSYNNTGSESLFPLCTKDQTSVAYEEQDSNQGLLDCKVPSPESGPIQA